MPAKPTRAKKAIQEKLDISALAAVGYVIPRVCIECGVDFKHRRHTRCKPCWKLTMIKSRGQETADMLDKLQIYERDNM